MVEFGGSPAICFLSDVMWSGQSWSRVGNCPSTKIRDVLFFFSFFLFFSGDGWVTILVH